jgi:hypothetical protein
MAIIDLYNDDMMITEPLRDQIANRSDKQNVVGNQAEKMKTRRCKQTTCTNAHMPKQKTIKKSQKKLNETSDGSKAHNDISNSRSFTDTIHDNMTAPQLFNTEQVLPPTHQYIRLNNNIIYLMVFGAFAATISVYLFLYIVH